MNFFESVNYLLSLGNEVTAMKLGLENIAKLLGALGNPQNDYLKAQIAGTNGKGSTVAFLESICVQSGIKVGATTSPHLVSITERIRISGTEISEKDFARLATKVRKTSEKLVEIGKLETVPTYFEQVTAIALTAFAEARVELAILETGLGGRFDATTAARAEIAAITPIDFDHQDILGSSLREIAAEKAAIIRADTKVVVAPQKKEAEAVINGRCREVKVEPIWATKDIESRIYDEAGQSIISTNFKTEKYNYPNVVLGLNGRHQAVNAALAVGIAETLRDFHFKISEQDIWLGLETARHQGRLEFYDGILFDGAHNVSGANALREYLNEFVRQPITMIFGAMRDKDLTEIAAALFPKADKLILTVPDNPRSLQTEELVKFIPENFTGEIERTDSVAAAINKARESSPERSLILITGSLYLVGEARKILKSEFDI